MVATNPIIYLLFLLLDLYWWVVVAAVIASWLIAFNVVNTYNSFVASVLRTLFALTEPVFRPVRRILPSIGGLDLSPIIVLLAISWIRYSVLPWLIINLGLY